MKRNTIRVLGIDPALTHSGFAIGEYDLDTKEISIERVNLLVTEGTKTKAIRKNSDDLRRCQEIAKKIHELVKNSDVVFSELPTGAQSSRAAFAFGMVLGIFAGVTTSPGFDPAFIQVLPSEVKLAIPGGSKTTSKEEIILWAAEKWPKVGWKCSRNGTFYVSRLEQKLTRDNEHAADACAVINAGVRTDQFLLFAKAFKVANTIK